MRHFLKEKIRKFKFFLKKSLLRILSLSYSADFRRSRLVELCLAALKRRFCKPQLTKLHFMKHETLKLDSKLKTPEEFLVQVQTLALQAYPIQSRNSSIAKILRKMSLRKRASQTRIMQMQNGNVLLTQRESDKLKTFRLEMPNGIRAKIFDKPETTTIQEICTLARRCLVFDQ